MLTKNAAHNNLNFSGKLFVKSTQPSELNTLAIQLRCRGNAVAQEKENNSEILVLTEDDGKNWVHKVYSEMNKSHCTSDLIGLVLDNGKKIQNGWNKIFFDNASQIIKQARGEEIPTLDLDEISNKNQLEIIRKIELEA